MITHAHTAYDGTRTYRNQRRVDVAYAGSADATITLARHYPDWRTFGSPTQAEGLFVLVAPGYRPAEAPLDAGAEGWLAMNPAEVQEFASPPAG